MKLNIVSWNGTTDINNDTTFDAWFESKQQFVPTRSGIYNERPEKWPKLSGAATDEHSFVFKVRCLGTIHSQRETVKGWFSIEDFTPRSLVFEDTADSNRQWYLEGIPTKIFEETPGVLAITLATDEPFLKTVLDSTGSLSITATGDSTSVTVLGNMNARPVIKITPTSAKTGEFGYARWVAVYNQIPPKAGKEFSNYSLDFGGVDTAALIAANKMQATGIDYLLQVDGETVDSWLGTTDGRGINTTDTALWGIVSLKPSIQLTIRSAIASTDTLAGTKLYFNVLNATESEAFRDALALSNKVMYLGTEAITYSSLAVDILGGYANVTERAAKGTTAGTHSAGATVRFLEHDIWQVYGSTNYSATSTDYYTVDNDNKPMFDLHSTNTSHIYTSFREVGAARANAWTSQLVLAPPRNDNLSRVYTGSHTANANPATEAGVKISAYQELAWRGSAAGYSWNLKNPSGITAMQITGDKYLASYTGAQWPAVAGLEYLHPTANVWITADNQAIPTTSAAWQAFTIASTDTGLFGGVAAYEARFIFRGSVYGTANNYAAIEAQSVTATLASTGIPSVTVGAEQSKYYLNASITNSATGEWIKITGVVSLNKTVTIDCDAKTVTYEDGTNLRAGLRLSSARPNWLDLEPGVNTLTYYEKAAAGVTVGIEWENRNTL